MLIFVENALDEDILVSRDGIDKLEGMLSFREQCLFPGRYVINPLSAVR